MSEVSGAIDPLLDDAPCGFVSFADDGTVHVVNRTLLALLGYERTELMGRRFETVLTVGSRIFYDTHFFPLLRLHGKAEEIFLLLRCKGGGDIAVLANGERRERGGAWITDCVFIRLQERRKFEDALLSAKKTAENALATAQAQREELEQANDLLERQAVELELSQQQLEEQAIELESQRAAAEHANEAKSSFLAMMSHELRTPLNAIGGYSQILEMGVHGPVNAEQIEIIGRIVRSQRHLLRLINDILNLARIEAGHVEYTLTEVNLAELAQWTFSMVEPQFAAHHLTHSVGVPADLTAVADREKLGQILLNLLSNAGKFTPAGGRVELSGRRSPVRESDVCIMVRDTGIGIPDDRLDAVFEPFVQVDVNRTSRVEGTGLGLAISRDLARGMGGDLKVESTLGQGSTFTLTLRAK